MVGEKLSIFVLAAFAFALRIFLILRDSVPFAYDMGRDLLWAKDIAFYHIPTLIGPAASIWGVYFGPLWFYFIAIPFLITNGDPVSPVYLGAASIVICGILAYFLFNKYLKSFWALVLAIILLFSAVLVNISTFAFHANVLPVLTVIAIYFLYLAVIKNLIFLPAAFFAVSLMFHADPAPAVVFSFVPVFTFFYFKLYKSKDLIKNIIFSLFFYLLPFVPQIIFELRNNFIQTRALIAYFTGENPSLSGQLPLFERIANRIFIFFDFLNASFFGGNIALTLIIVPILIWGIFKFFKDAKDRKLRILFKINILSLGLFFLIFTFLITVEVKNWYLYPLTIFWAFLIICGLLGLTKRKAAVFLFMMIFLVLNITPFFQKERFIKSGSDPAQLVNQMEAINLIYEDSQKENFSVYTFTPSIYDHNYQYLFWREGVIKKRGLPSDFAYLPNQPDYVRNKNIYAKPSLFQSTIIYLIIENAAENEFYSKNNWLNNFEGFKIVWEKNINNAIVVQKRIQ